MKIAVKTLVSFIVLMGCISGDLLAQNSESVDYKPVIGGVMRTRYEYDLDHNQSRFQVRNARINITGNIAPFISYFVQTDVCDCGSFKFLDAYGRFNVNRWLKVQIGRQRIPFSVDASRAPGNYYFSNRSFIGKQVGNVRAIGVKAMTVIPGTTAYLDAGIFQMQGASQTGWTRQRFDYAAKLGYKMGNVKAEIGIESVIPDSIRTNLLDASLNWSFGRWMLEGEYTNKAYTHDSHATVHAYNIMANYSLPLESKTFNVLSFQGRFDGITDHSNGQRNNLNKLITNDIGRQRLTLGSTLGYIKGKLKTELRLNYEKYFYQHGYKPSLGNGDKLVAEVMVAF